MPIPLVYIGIIISINHLSDGALFAAVCDALSLI